MHLQRVGTLLAVLGLVACSGSTSDDKSEREASLAGANANKEAVLALFQGALEGKTPPLPAGLPIHLRQGFAPLDVDTIVSDSRLNPEGRELNEAETSQLIDLAAKHEHRRQVHFQVADAVRESVVAEHVDAGLFTTLEPGQGRPLAADSIFRQVLEHEVHGRVLVEIDPEEDGRIGMYHSLERDLRTEADLELYRFFQGLGQATSESPNADS